MSYQINTAQKRFLAVLIVTPILAACSATMNQNSMIESVVRSVPLSNGKTLSVGYKVPDDSAQCQLVNDTSRNWAMAQTTGGLKLGGGRQLLEEEATDSVNQRPQDGINYVALLLPNESYIGAVNLAYGDQAKTSYFRCVNPPQPH